MEVSGETIGDIRQILDYLEDDEKRHWMEEGKPKDGHVYNIMQRVRKALN